MKKLFLPLLMLCLLLGSIQAEAAVNPCNPCNPCGGKAKNPCNPCNPCGGKMAKVKMPAVNPCHAKYGTVFYVADPMGRNTITFTSEAPLEDIIGTTNQIYGYVVFDPNRPENGGRGVFTVPVASLDTGIPLRDEHLHSEMWLNAAEHPQIEFTIDFAKDIKVAKITHNSKTYKGMATGEFTLNGKTRTIEVPLTVTYMAESDLTRQKMPGDLLAGKTKLELALRNYGITGPPGMDLIGSQVSDKIGVSVTFVASSKKPSAGTPCNPCNPCNPCGGKNPCNPCNPCGGKKAKNPCNPCG